MINAFFSSFSKMRFSVDRSGFLILIARCDPLHNHPHSSLSCGSFGLGQARPGQAKPFVHVQGTVKQIEADRYGNDSRKRGYEVCMGWGVSVFQTTRRKGTSLGCRNKGATRSLSFFCLFSLGSSESTLPCYIPNTHTNTHFPPPSSILPPFSHTCLPPWFFFPSLTPPYSFFSLGSWSSCWNKDNKECLEKNKNKKVIIKKDAWS